MANSALPGFITVPNPTQGRTTTGSTTLTIDDHGTSLVSTASLPVSYILPAGEEFAGMKVRSYQAGAGQISYVPEAGASVIDGALKSLGSYTNGYFVDIENLGGSVWVVLGDTTEGRQTWSILGHDTIKEGDACSFAIFYPDEIAAYDTGVAIKITGTGFASAGTDYSLEDAITRYCLIDGNVEFDGTDILTVFPSARNPIVLTFFVNPEYTASGDRDITIALSDAAVGTISTAVATTTILNVSKPTDPSLLFPTFTQAVSIAAASGQAQINLEDVTGIELDCTVTGSANIPALSWVTGISGNTITLSANLTGDITATTELTFTPPGFWFDFSTSTGVTMDGSNRVATITDKVNGYTMTQATVGNKPIYTASDLNGLGGLAFSNQWLSVRPPDSFTRTTSGSTASGQSAMVMSSVAGLVVGMHVDATNVGASITAINANTLTLSANTIGTIASGTAIYFTPAASRHPLITLLRAAAQKYTVIMVSKNRGTGTGWYYSFGAKEASLNITSGAFVGSPYATTELTSQLAQNRPYLWTFLSDGEGYQVYYNGHHSTIPLTLTADWDTTTFTMQVADSTGCGQGMQLWSPVSGLASAGNPNIQSIPDSTHVTSVVKPSRTIPAGTIIYASKPYTENGSHTFTPESNPTYFSLGARNPQGLNPGNVNINEFIVVPRILSLQERRGVEIYLADKWGVGTTTTTTASAAAGDTKLILTSLTGIGVGMILDATTGIAANTAVIGMNIGSSYVLIDTQVLAPGVANGASLTFNGPAFKRPELLDITGFIPTVKDDFLNGLQLWNGTTGYEPYYGDPNAPGTFNAAYGSAGHGSSNSGSFEKEWYLDILNWTPWLTYNPFSAATPDDAPSGELVITASPADPAILASIGYTLPNTTAYTYTSGYFRNRSDITTAQQYGYWEARIKSDGHIGSWGAFWLQTTDGRWPPEIDIYEVYGERAAHCPTALHSNAGLPNTNYAPVFSDNSCSDYGNLIVDHTREYTLFGVEVSPTSVDLYINRELYRSYPNRWDMHTPWFTQFNLAVRSNNVSETMAMHIDYWGIWKRNPQTPSIPGGTQAETTTLVTAMTTPPSGARQTTINTLISSLKSYTTSFGDTLWNALDFLYMVAAHDAQAARINWKDPSKIGTVVGSPTFTVDRGYVGVLDTSYIDTGIAPATATWGMTNAQNHIGGCVVTSTTSNSNIIRSTNYFAQYNSNANVASRNRRTTGISTTVPGGTINGRCVMVRYEWHFTNFINGDLIKCTMLSNTNPALDTDNMFLANGTAKVACAHGGKYLSPDDVEYLDALLYDYLHAVGAQ